MNIPKRHHYIPRMLLNRFADSRGIFHVYDKRIPEKGIQTRTSESLFVERHLYTQVNADGAKDVSVETDFLSALEGKANPVIEKIISAAKRGHPINLTPEEKNIWISFFYCQYARVPETTRKIKEQVRQEVDKDIELLSLFRTFNDSELAFLGSEKTMERIQKNASITSLRETDPEVYEILSEKRICVAVVRNFKPKRSFVIGSNPVLKLSHPGRAHLSDPTVEVWLPLSRDVIVSPCSGKKDRVISLRNSHIESLNRSAFDHCDVIAGCSRELIESLVNHVDS